MATQDDKGRGFYIHWGVPGVLLVGWLVTVVWFMATTASAVEANTSFRLDVGPRVYALEASDGRISAQMGNICDRLSELKGEVRGLRDDLKEP